MSEVRCLELSVMLWFVHLACVLGAAQFAVPLRWHLSSRDKPAAPKGVLFGRVNRALANYVENFTVFALSIWRSSPPINREDGVLRLGL